MFPHAKLGPDFDQKNSESPARTRACSRLAARNSKLYFITNFAIVANCIFEVPS